MLITGSAQRMGAYFAKAAHADGYNIVLHYRHSEQQTQALQSQLNNIRDKSCIVVQADFNQKNNFSEIIDTIKSHFNRLDVLVNNASDFFATQADKVTENQYEELFNSNVKGPLFLSKACFSLLNKSKGNIINLVDIHADKPLKDYPVYSMAKSANKMMVKALAKEFAPNIRVNGISPGYIQDPIDGKKICNIIKSRIALDKKGDIKNIYQTLKFLIENNYITGQIVNVDGGRSLNM
ncbi:MAG: pteridine reductase [Marinicellaceae bacterium]